MVGAVAALHDYEAPRRCDLRKALSQSQRGIRARQKLRRDHSYLEVARAVHLPVSMNGFSDAFAALTANK